MFQSSSNRVICGGTTGGIVRCVHCGPEVIQPGKTPAGYFLDMQGTRQLFVAR